MKTKNTFLTVAGAITLLLNPFMLNAQWSAVRYDQHNIFHNVSTPSANTVFVTGVEPISSQNFILRTNDAGVNWDSISFNTATDIFLLTELYFFDVNTGFAGGTKNGNQVLLKTTDNGNSWTDITPGPTSSASINSVHFIDAQNGAATDGAFLYKTSNGGTTWTPVSSPFNMRDLYFFNLNEGVACGNNGAAVVMKTYDGGQNWYPIFSDYDSNLFVSSFAKLDIINSNVFFTAMENTNKLYRTLSHGDYWETIAVDSVNFIRDFNFTSADDGHILAELGWAQEYRILITADAAQNCTMQYTTGWNFYGGGVVLNAFSFVDQTGYTTGSNGLVKKYFPSAAGINEERFNQTASVYPNPFSTTATFQITGWNELKTTQAELKIHDALGRQVFHTDLHAPHFELNRGDLTKGIYIYSVTRGNEILATGKLVVTD